MKKCCHNWLSFSLIISHFVFQTFWAKIIFDIWKFEASLEISFQFLKKFCRCIPPEFFFYMIKILIGIFTRSYLFEYNLLQVRIGMTWGNENPAMTDFVSPYLWIHCLAKSCSFKNSDVSPLTKVAWSTKFNTSSSSIPS